MEGRGGANLISIMLGQNDNENSSKVFTTTVVITIIFATFMSIVGFISLRPMLSLLGASGDVLTSGYQYMSVIYMGVIFWVLPFTLSCTVRAEGRAMLAMSAMVVSALLNILLDYIFIIRLNWGVNGVAFATIIAQFTGFVILLSYYMRSDSIRFNRLYIKPEWSIVKRLFSVGLPSYFVTVGSGVSLMVL